ncbi:MAG: hypothetical protein ACRD2W_05030 [Acidimicrobiales bacterium]
MNVRRMAVVVAAALACVAAQAAPAERWEQWRGLPGVFDIVGPRMDGRLVAAGTGRLFLVDADGTITPYADGYRTDPAFENYIAVAPSPAPAGPGCSFMPDEVFALEIGGPVRIIRVDTAGRASTFVDLPGYEFLSGLEFDTVGRFANRLLVTARKVGSGGRTSVLAIDCRDQVTTIMDNGPVVEGGLAVAPLTFGRFAGALIAPDEHGGDIVAFRPDGTSEVVFNPNLATGADVGVESLGFVPRDFFPNGVAYVADRLSPGAPTIGTDTILRLTGVALARAGVREGDLLVSTESVGRTIAVRCEATCTVIPVAEATAAAHIEGHITAVLPPALDLATTVPPPTGPGRATPWGLVAGVATAAVLTAGLVWFAVRRRHAVDGP